MTTTTMMTLLCHRHHKIVATTTKAAEIDLLIRYHSYRKAPAFQAALKKQYLKYVRDTRNVLNKPDSMLDWWKQNKKNYSQLSAIPVRALIQTRSGCDIDRSFNYFSNMTRYPVSTAMAPITKETRVMANNNKKDIAAIEFGVYDIK